jgi:DNA polymerase III sliding clamp (beta) subunit (PCNA family)
MDTKSLFQVYDYLLLEVDKNELRGSATNGNISVTGTIEVDGPLKGKFKALISPGSIIETLSKIPDELVTLELIQETLTFRLIGAIGEYKTGLNMADVDAFPVLAKAIEPEFFLTSNDIEALHICSQMASTDELRPAFTWINLRKKDGLVEFIATNGHGLSILPSTADVCEILPGSGINMPAKTVNRLLALYKSVGSKEQFPVSLTNSSYSSQGYILVGIGGFIVSFLTANDPLGHQFPDIDTILPGKFSRVFTIDRIPLLMAISTSRTYATRVVLSFRRNLEIVSKDDLGNGHISFSELPYTDNSATDQTEATFGMGIKLLAGILNNIVSDKVVLKFNGPKNPIVINPQEHEIVSSDDQKKILNGGHQHINFLLMPVLIQ